MSAVPTIPGPPSASLGVDIGPDGISISASISLDRCNARPIFVYAVSDGGNIWRLVDPLSPAEKVPVFKEWTEEKTTPRGHWEKVPIPKEKPKEPEKPKPKPPKEICEVIEYVIPGSLFKFDEPGKNFGETDPRAFEPSSPLQPTAIGPEIDAKLDLPTQDGDPLPAGVERKIVLFAHADMCAPYSYNKGLTSRRANAVSRLLSPRAQSVVLNKVGGSLGSPCADYNPKVGPNDHELAAENSPTGKATGGNGNIDNRRVELFILPDWADPAKSEVKKLLEQIFDELVPARASDSARMIQPSEWTRGGFPCTKQSVRICHKLMSPFTSPGETATTQLESRDHRNATASGAPLGEGPAYRHCEFYARFKAGIKNLKVCVPGETPPEKPIEPPPEPEQQYTYKWVEDPPLVEQVGEYHPPPGEHYGYYMDEMVRKGVQANPQFAPVIQVAPNNEVNADDFNLIKAGPIRVVKMDIGFWGDRRVRDISRQAGFRREPSRYFGMIEGPFVFLCFFETPDNAGFVRECSDQFDEELTPLSARLQQAVRDAGFRILIISKAVAEDGPPANRLKIFFPDMHLPRKFDERDPVYSSDECVARADRVKSMVLHQLKRDYRLPAIQTPWLAWADRQLLRDFFEAGAPRLKLPHWNTGRKMSNPFEAEGEGFLSKAMDGVKKAMQALFQVGYYMFEFTQDDYRRMVRKYPDNFPEKGFGRTKDILSNWYYGFETDRNTPPPRDNSPQGELKSMIPGVVAEVADANFGTSLGPSAGTPPAQERYDRLDAGPSRDLLRFLRVVQTQRGQGLSVEVFQTGDLYELWQNTRFLFEDFAFSTRPEPQMPEMAQSLMPNKGGSKGGSTFDKVKSAATDLLKAAARMLVLSLLGGSNAKESDLWFRRDSEKDRPDDQPETSPPEESWNFGLPDTDWRVPRFTGPSGGGVGLGMSGPLKTANLPYTYMPPTEFPWENERGSTYLANETRRRIQQVLGCEVHVRTDNTGRTEDTQLLGGANIVGRNRDMGLWNKAVVETFGRLGTTFIYGNHDCMRGVPRDGGLGSAAPFHSEAGLWVEHGHRYEDSNIDGQPFGSFITNLAYEIQELALYEGLLDEFILHREQSLFQPGILQWFLLTEFGLESLSDFTEPPERVPPVNRFRICVNSHTHQPDLVVANFIFKDREVSQVELPLVGKVSAETLINGGLAALKAILLMKKIVEWFKAWDERGGFQKWWADINGDKIDWFSDFAGLASCVDRALEFARQYGESQYNALRREFEQSGQSLKDAIDQNRRNVGL